LRKPKTFKISYKGNDLVPTSQREEEEEEARETRKYERERERESLDKLGSRRGGAKKKSGREWGVN
jgi:hypothetical protein